MRYMLLIYSDPATYENMSEAERGARSQEYFAIAREMRERGERDSGEALQPTTTATTVRVRDGKRLTTDGPFAETKEHLVGYYIVRGKNLDDALDYAARIPDARVGSVEVRPILEMPVTA
jgi:hypothetical protein